MILITGVSGFIGNSLYRELVRRDCRVFGLSRQVNLTDMMSIIQTNYDEAHLTEIINEVGASLIIHTAGSSSVGGSILDPESDYISSVELYKKILGSALNAKFPPKIVFISSAAVYGNLGKMMLHEDLVCKPISPYGVNKKICEDIGLDYHHRYGIEVIALRIFSTFGELQKRLLIWDIYNKFKERNTILLSGSGFEMRDYCHIDDLISQIITVAQAANIKSKILNLGTGFPRTISNVAYSIGKNFMEEKYYNFSAISREGDPLHLIPDITNFLTESKWMLRDNFEPKIAEVINSWRH